MGRTAVGQHINPNKFASECQRVNEHRPTSVNERRPNSTAILKSKFLAGLEDGSLATILAAAKYRKVGRDQVILTAGEPAAHLFLLSAGRAKYYRNTKDGEEVLF